MRWWGVLLLPLALASPAPAPPSPAPHPAASTLVDVLSASSQHQLLLAAFQRARLVPTLNRLNGSTLLAPTDDAIRQEKDREQERGLSGTDEEGVWSAVVEWVEQGQPEKALLTQPDNLQLALRDTLLFHLLNYTLFPPPPTNSSDSDSAPEPLPFDVPLLQETLYFPSLFPYNRSFPAPPSLPGTEPNKPDPDAPKDRPEGLLHGEGQKVRVLRKKSGDEVWVGVDWKGEGGVKMVNETIFAANGAMVPLDGVLSKPNDLASLVRSRPELSTLASLLPPQVLDYLTTAPHVTLFAPTNEAWAALSDLEMRYLRSGFAELDLSEIFGDSASQAGAGKGKIGYLERLVGQKGGNASEVTTLRNGTLEVSGGKDFTEASVNGTRVKMGDIFAKNGVLHTVPSLLLPEGSLYLTAEKYLIALNATRFVSLLRSVNLSHYVQIPSHEPGTVLRSSPLPPLLETSSMPQVPLKAMDAASSRRERYTILAVKDDVLEPFFAAAGPLVPSSFSSLSSSPVLNGRPLPPEGSPALKELLSYHIVTGSWRPSELEDGMLLGTELRTDQLKGSRQSVVVGVQGEDGSRGEGWGQVRKGKGEEKEQGTISWGGATIVADPITVGGSIIYLVSSLIDPPSSVVTAAVTDLRLSTFVASVYAAALDGTLSMQPAITYLVPTNEAFAALGLTMNYLLLPSSRSELRSVLQYHAIDEIVYLDSFPRTGSARYPTLLDGAEVYLERDRNGTLSFHGPTLGGLPANGDLRDAGIVEGDILTETGAIHIVDQVELPAELDITLEKLLLGAKANTMVELIKLANMTWVLEGKRQPSDRDDVERYGEKKKKRGKDDDRYAGDIDWAYTILCPTDKALSRLNLTYYRSTPSALEALVRLHVIPCSSSTPLFASSPSEPGAPLLLEDAKTYATLLDKSKRGGSSAYGSVAFRKTGGDEWLVGVEGARGARGETDAARVLGWGKATPWFVNEDDQEGHFSYSSSAAFSALRRKGSTKLAPAGGVISIDSVLLPYEPGWFRRWGWIALSSLVAVLVLAVVGFFAYRRWKKRREEKYERLLQEEDDD
ncbi:hypothetical protein JCM8547_000334 [Rhodosporidiobolus lusitaniae]